MSILHTETIVVINQARTASAARAYREAAGIRLRAVAREMGFSAMYLSDLETGKRKWTPTKAVSFQRAVDRLKEEKEK